LKKLSVAIVGVLGVCVFAFQNCAKMKSGAAGSSESASTSTSGTLNTNPPTNPNDPLNVVVADSNTIQNNNAVVPVKLNKANTADVQVVWKTIDGSAIAGNEYTASSGTLTIPAGSVTGTIRIPILHSDSSDVSFSLEITSVSAGAIGRAQATILVAANSVQYVFKNLWKSMSLSGAPTGLVQPTAVWTGSNMIVWGTTAVSLGAQPSGAIYDPATDTWKAISKVGAPSARAAHTAVWTGTRMIIWGGYWTGGTSGLLVLNSGASYDPATDTWAALPTANAPIWANATGWAHGPVWTGTQLLACCWGDPTAPTIYQGAKLGAQYNPVTNTWTDLPTANAPPIKFQGGQGILVGNKYIWFGGFDSSTFQNTGGILDLTTSLWSATSLVGAPSPRAYTLGVSTGTKAIFFGPSDDGGVFDPLANTWSSIAPTGMGSFNQAPVVWTGSGMVLFRSGSAGVSAANLLYDPAKNTWTALSTVNAPPPGYYVSVWTGSSILYFGEASGSSANPGGIFY
jgi:hypothetical protein